LKPPDVLERLLAHEAREQAIRGPSGDFQRDLRSRGRNGPT